MTSSGENGTKRGWAIRVGPWSTVALVGVAVALVNATSGIIEGAGDHWIEPVLWEGTSALTVIALAPLVGWAVRRWPLRGGGGLLVPALIHFGLTVPFAAVHILAIWLSREAAYWAAGAHYGFFDDGVAITLLYEWRKDVLIYAALAATYWVFQYVAERRLAAAQPASPERIEVRDGGAAVFLAPGDVTHVEAAGNYVEFHSAAKTHLVRGTLAAWGARLAAKGFVRVHRSRLVNRARIAAIKPTPAGDFEIALDTGQTLAGSRRYRAALERAPAQ